jgi:rod shape-determining protein MreC
VIISKRKLLVPSLVAILLIVLFIFQPPFINRLRTAFVDFSKIPLKLTHNFLKEIKLIFSYRRLYKENINLQKEMDLLNRKMVEFKEIYQENKRLEKLLSFKHKLPFSTVAARVIGRDSSNWISALIIDKGSKDNLRVGMPVIGGVGLVGKLVEVGSSTSRVLLINDSNFKVAALIQDSRDEGIVSGSLGGKCRMYFLSLESEVKTNDRVITSGLGGVFPKGLLIGRVIDVDIDASGLMKNCLIEPTTDLSRLEEVLIILK